MTTTELRAVWETATKDERNALIAERVMEWKRHGPADDVLWMRVDGIARIPHRLADQWNPLNFIADAFEVVEHAAPKYDLDLARVANQIPWRAIFYCRVRPSKMSVATCPTAPEAICLAALLTTAEDG
jgi:hypothetical protein